MVKTQINSNRSAFRSNRVIARTTSETRRTKQSSQDCRVVPPELLAMTKFDKNINNLRSELILAFWLTFALLAFPQISTAGSLQLVTYYPAPQGVYDRLTLIPQENLPSPCTIGTLMTDQASGKIYYCRDVSGTGTWGYVSNIWTASGNDVYPTDTDTKPLIFAGIGTSIPSFKLTLDNDGGILAMGEFGSGTILSNWVAPMAARGLLWYPRKAAFRAGYASDTQWDDANIGDYSMSLGKDSISKGNYSVTIGSENIVNGQYSVMFGNSYGYAVSGDYTTSLCPYSGSNVAGSYNVSAGYAGSTYADYVTAGFGDHIDAQATGSTISSGYFNNAGTGHPDPSQNSYSTICGGEFNVISPAKYASMGGGDTNSISKDYATIGGGYRNIASGTYSYIGGGDRNTASGSYSVIGGGFINSASGNYSAIAGGRSNQATKDYAVSLGGYTNLTNGAYSLIAGGSYNTISGDYSVIAGGDHNTVAGDYSWAGGRYMNLSALADRTFLWGYTDTNISIQTPDAFILAPGVGTIQGTVYNPKLGINQTNPSAILNISLPLGNNSDFFAITSTSGATAGDIFIINRNGNVGIANANPQYPLQIGTGITNGNGAYLTVGGVWTSTSSRTFKDNIKALDTQTALEAFQKLNPVTYSYKANKAEHHVGFIAEDVPDLVAEEGHRGLTAMPVTAILTAVLKDQKKNIAEQNEILNQLENDVQSLKNEIAASP